MKVRLLWLVSVLVLGGLVGLLIVRDPGYVLVAYDQAAVETSLWFALLVLAGTYLVVRVLLYVLRRVVRGRGELARWSAERRSKSADQRTLRGLLLMAEGYWGAARKQLQQAAPRAAMPVINLLHAARAAELEGDPAGREALLREARASGADAETAIDFVQGSLEHGAAQWSQARATLERLHARVPAHGAVAWMLADCYRAQRDWQALAGLLPALKRDRAGTARFERLETEALLGRLEDGEEPPESVWAGLSKSLRHAPALASGYARAQLDRAPDEAERALRDALAHVWDAELVELYGRVASGDPARQLAVAEGWLKSHPDDATLFLTLGRLALRNRRWAAAREHFEMSVRLAPTPAAQGELGRLCVALGEPRGVELLQAALPGLPLLPLPAQGAPTSDP